MTGSNGCKDNLRFLTLNVNGLGDHVKRRMVFKALRSYKNTVICLQETHLQMAGREWIQNLWGGPVSLVGESSQAGGLMTMVSLDTQAEVKVLYADRLASFLVTKITIQGKQFIVVNVYFPTADKEKVQIRTLQNLEGILSLYAGESVIVMGDLNICMDANLDRLNHVGMSIVNPGFRGELNSFIEAFSLADVWRVQHPGVQGFTWYRVNKGSRLDYILCPTHLLGQIHHCEIRDVAFSDHRMVIAELGPKVEARGKGFWKLNSALLDIPEVFESLVDLINEKKDSYQDMDHSVRWELLKFELRNFFRKWNSDIVKERNKVMTDLQNGIRELGEKGELLQDELEMMHNMRRELYSLQHEAENKAFLRARCNWAMYGGKPTHFFLNLEKNSFEGRVINILLDEEERVITEPEEILSYEKRQFEERYSCRVENGGTPDPYSSADSGVLDDEERDGLDEELTLDELEKAVRSMKNNKSPGSDGLTAEFYKRCWFLIGDWLLDSINAGFVKGMLSPDQRRGVISLIPKKGKDKRRLRNWRPITLLNLDYKILAKALDNRMSSVIAKLVHPNQTGFMAGRYIGSNLRNTDDVISYFRSSEGGLVSSLDYEMAFDTLDREFLFKVLKAGNFGEVFIRWIKLLYENVEGCILNNGHSSGWFGLDAGLRQGCPASPHLFVLAVEKLAHAIRLKSSIRGVSIGGAEYKLSQYADDTTLFVRDGLSMENALDMVQDFSRFSGLRLNVQKSKIMRVNTSTSLGVEGGKLQEVESLEVLGLSFHAAGRNTEECRRDYGKYLDKMRLICDKWRKRKLNLKAKVTVLNTLVFPVLYYAAQNSHCPKFVEEEVRRLTMDFMWNGHRPKISMNTLFQSVSQGGLGLHNFSSRVFAGRIAWAKRMIQNTTDDFWLEYFCTCCNVEEVLDVLCRRQRVQLEGLPSFYRGVLEAWQKYYAVHPNTDAAVRAEPLWRNRFLQWRALRRYQVMWANRGLSRINDLIVEGKIMSLSRLNERYELSLSKRTYEAMVKVIPEDFLGCLKEEDSEVMGAGLFVPNDKGELVDLANITVKAVYRVRIWTEARVPTAVRRWQELYEGSEWVESEGMWEHWRRLPFRLTREVRLQSFYYRLLNRIIPCNVYLQQLRVKESVECSFCGDRDDLYHFFYGCPETKAFWASLGKWLRQNSAVIALPRTISEVEFLLGILDTDEMDLRLNFILLLGKFYIYKEKVFGKGLLEPYKFLVELKNVLLVERLACLREHSLRKKFTKWQLFFDEL